METLKREKEEFRKSRATTGRNMGTSSVGTEHVAGGSTSTDGIGGEVGEDTTGGKAEWDPE